MTSQVFKCNAMKNKSIMTIDCVFKQTGYHKQNKDSTDSVVYRLVEPRRKMQPSLIILIQPWLRNYSQWLKIITTVQKILGKHSVKGFCW